MKLRLLTDEERRIVAMKHADVTLNIVFNVESLCAEKVKKAIEELVEQVELAGYDNPIDEAYRKALLDLKQTLFGGEE